MSGSRPSAAGRDLFSRLRPGTTTGPRSRCGHLNTTGIEKAYACSLFFGARAPAERGVRQGLEEEEEEDAASPTLPCNIFSPNPVRKYFFCSLKTQPLLISSFK